MITSEGPVESPRSLLLVAAVPSEVIVSGVEQDAIVNKSTHKPALRVILQSISILLQIKINNHTLPHRIIAPLLLSGKQFSIEIKYSA
jgi:hypothetical protein